MKLREYQVEWLGRIREAAKKHRRILLRAGTGSGKTVVAVALMREATRNDQNCLFLVHRRELVEQCVKRLGERGEEEVGVILAGSKEQRSQPIQVASIQTLNRRKLPPADVIIIDEAHHAAARSYRELLARYPRARVYGLTATPERLDGQPLGDLFEVIVESAPESDLVEAGFLASPRIWSHPTDDLRGVHLKGGDYDAEEVWEKADRRKLVGDVVDHWQRFAAGLQTVAYAINLRHGEMLLRRFQQAGVPSAMVHGGTPRAERASLLAAIRSGGIRVLVNVAILTEGWDAPEVRCAVVCRPTTSIAFWRQMCGRVTRPGETPIILDHAGNALLHGGPLEPIPWSLESKRERTKHGSQRTASKECPGCGCAVGIGKKECPNCGYEFWTTEPPEEVQAWLREVTGPSLRERAVEMVKNGATRVATARAVGVSAHCIWRWCKAAGLSPGTGPVLSSKEERLERERARYRANREKFLGRLRVYREPKKKERARLEAARRAANLAEHRKRGRERYAANAEILREYRRAYRARKKAQAAE